MRNIQTQTAPGTFLRGDRIPTGRAARLWSRASRQTTGTVRETAGRLNEDIKAVSSSFQTLSDNSERISDDTNRQFAVVQEIDSTTRALIDALENTYLRLESQNLEIREISATIEEMFGNLERVTENLKQTTEFTTDLERRTRQGEEGGCTPPLLRYQAVKETSVLIYEVIDAVNNVAEQTNLLSINASIEAAHAGRARRVRRRCRGDQEARDASAAGPERSMPT